MRTPILTLVARTASALLVAGTLAASAAHADAKLDRNAIPAPGPAPAFHVPAWTHITLANGAQLAVCPKHDLPLVAVTITFVGGSYAYEPAEKLGLAGFTAQMLSEGTPTRTADQISEAQQLLGTNINASIGGESGSLGFTALSAKLEPALALVADMMLHSTFPAPALERIRARALVQLKQSRDQPTTIAMNAFSRVTYGADHPYGRVTSDATLKAITRDDVAAFAAAYFRPGRAVITVAGDVEPAAVKAAIEKAFAGWPAGGAAPDWKYPAPPAPGPTTIDLVDKPGAPQSVIAIGLPGPPRSTPDYFALRVMNTVLGELFQSRLNHDIREVHGFSYGVSSNFAFGHGPGAFRTGGSVVGAKTDSSLIEFMAQLRGARGDIPFTDDELAQSKESLVQSLPRMFGSVNGTAGAIATLYTQDLPETYYRDFPAQVRAVTPAECTRVAKQYLDLAHVNIVVVGDRAAIEKPLAATGIAPLVVIDADAKPVTAAPAK